MGLHAQRIYGPSFEAPAPVHADTDGTGWVDVSSGTGIGGATLDTVTAFHGQSSEKLSFRSRGDGATAATGRAAVANRGLGNEGLYFEGGKDYEGYFWAKALKPVSLVVSLEAWTVDGKAPTVLASSTIAVATSGEDWQMFNFSLTPSAGTECDGIQPGGAIATAANITCPVNGTYNPTGPMSDRTAHVCVRCGGQFTLALQSPGEVNLDYVYMSPGEWGRYKGLPVLAEGVKWLQGMGTSLFRMGGSFCSGNNYFCAFLLSGGSTPDDLSIDPVICSRFSSLFVSFVLSKTMVIALWMPWQGSGGGACRGPGPQQLPPGATISKAGG